MFDNATIQKRAMIVFFFLFAVLSFVFGIAAMQAVRLEAANEIDEIIQESMEEEQKFQEHYKMLRAAHDKVREECSRLEQSYDELERMPDTLPDFKIQAF